METRDKEIERLNRLLDGGRPVEAVLREGKKDSSERVVAHLNVQVILYTVMIRFSARGAYLLLAPQGRVLIGDRALIRDRALI